MKVFSETLCMYRCKINSIKIKFFHSRVAKPVFKISDDGSVNEDEWSVTAKMACTGQHTNIKPSSPSTCSIRQVYIVLLYSPHKIPIFNLFNFLKIK